MTPLSFHSHHPLSCKEVIICSQALQYNMIISEDHILQEEFNNLTRIILACTDLLHSIIKNEKSLDPYHNNLLSQRTPQTLTKVLPIITPFSDIGKLFTATLHRNWQTIAIDTTLATISPSKPLSAYTKFSNIHSHVHSEKAQWFFTAGFLTLLPIYTHINQYIYTHSNIPTVVTLPLLLIKHTQLILVLQTT